MKIRPLLCALACVAAVSAAAAWGAEKTAPAAKPAAEKAPTTPTAEQTAAMQEMLKANAPGAAHQLLAEMAGDWNMSIKGWTTADAPPSESQGTATRTMIMGGRYLREDVSGNMMNMPFTGMSITGYDNTKQKYVGTWIDNMTTGIFTSEGTYDPASKTLTCTGTMYDPMAKKDVVVRTVTRTVDPNTQVFEWYSPGPDGKEMKSIEITYTRKTS